MHSTLARPLLALLTVVALLTGGLVLGSPAQADQTRDFLVRTPFDGNGRAKVKGYVRWESRKEASAHVTLDDVCPGDGQGAELQWLAKFRYGRIKLNQAYDRGCTEDPWVGLYSMQKPGAGKLLYIRIVVCEVDFTEYGKDYGPCRAKKMRNPLA